MNSKPLNKLVRAASLTIPALSLLAAGPSLANAAEAGHVSRGYEMVSPAQKGATDVNPLNTVQSSADGRRVLFSALNGLPGSEASGVGSYFLGERSSTQWTTTPVEPPTKNSNGQLIYTSVASSADLGKVLQASRVALTPGATPDGGNVYVRDSATGTRALLATGPKSLFTHFAFPGALPFGGATPDFSHVLLQSDVKLTDGAVEGVSNVYEWTASEGLRLASVLPDGTTDPAGSTSAPQLPTQSHGPISDDGRRIVFAAGSSGALFLREGGVTTPISVSQRAGDPPTPQTARFVSMTSDGGSIFFLSFVKLTNESTAGTEELYRYDVDSGTLTDLTVTIDPADPNGAYVTQVLGVTNDGADAYFVANSNLAPGGTSAAPSLYHWNTEDGARFVARLDPGTEYIQPGTWSLSPNGRFVAFSSFARITDADNAGSTCPATTAGNPAGTCSEVYRYDARANGQKVVCVSCGVSEPTSHANLGIQDAMISDYTGRRVLDDGRVFFNSGDALVARDTNGKVDVYESDGATPALISSGQSDTDATFADATPGGNNVYFFTAERLVAQDVDNLIDVYDARIGGGLAAQGPPPLGLPACREDGCQGAPSVAPRLPSAGSIGMPGDRGLQSPARPAATAKPKVTKPGVVRGTTARLSVRVSGKGRIRTQGSGLTPASTVATKSGLYRVAVRLSAKSQRALRRERRLTVQVTVQFIPRTGATSSARIPVTFRVATSIKKGRS